MRTWKNFSYTKIVRDSLLQTRFNQYDSLQFP